MLGKRTQIAAPINRIEKSMKTVAELITKYA